MTTRLVSFEITSCHECPFHEIEIGIGNHVHSCLKYRHQTFTIKDYDNFNKMFFEMKSWFNNCTQWPIKEE